MPLIKRVAWVCLFQNGAIAATDMFGEQIPELQGMYSIERHRRILLEALPGCTLQGFEVLPPGFTQSANDWAQYFVGQNMSYEEIQKI